MSATVQLADGRHVATDSAEFKVECLARHVLRLRTLDERRAWIADFEKRAGALAAADLMTAMQAVHGSKTNSPRENR